ncbi:hypothetical protein APX70_200212 [Pseudomonas syringae pv. maculicola]|uniref:Uncharacterized protein n=1 Tax=Pseudomonas syringae pv. maculicola TaxID=59511 RepID=A0A3M2ZWN6_PSEYM|nr:hypothetical protein APX70_200212 [Pseudomonas syringae pv. maculicola]
MLVAAQPRQFIFLQTPLTAHAVHDLYLFRVAGNRPQ